MSPPLLRPLNSLLHRRHCSMTLASLSPGSWPATRAAPTRLLVRSADVAGVVLAPRAGGVLNAQRPHLELWARDMEERQGLARATIGRRLSTVAGLYRFAVIDGTLDRSPADYVRRPHISTESTTLGLDRMELGAFIAQAAGRRSVDHALAASSDCSGCGSVKRAPSTSRTSTPPADMAPSPYWAKATSSPSSLSRRGLRARRRPGSQRTRPRSAVAHALGRRMDRHGAPHRAPPGQARGITKHISPHSLRHSFITAALDAGVQLRDVQIAARHADPRTTTRYDRARDNLDRHASYIVTAFIAGAA